MGRQSACKGLLSILRIRRSTCINVRTACVASSSNVPPSHGAFLLVGGKDQRRQRKQNRIGKGDHRRRTLRGLAALSVGWNKYKEDRAAQKNRKGNG